MNIFKIFLNAAFFSIKNFSSLLILNLLFLFFLLSSIGVFLGFNFFAVAILSFFSLSLDSIFIQILLGFSILLGFLVAAALFFPAFGSYFYFCFDFIRFKKSTNIIDFLEHFEKNFLTYYLAGLVVFGPVALVGFLISIFSSFLNLFTFIIGLIVLAVFSFYWFVSSFATYPALVIENQKILAAFFKSRKIAKKYFIQSSLLLLLLIFIKFFGLVLLIFYPFYHIFFFLPFFVFTYLEYYSLAKN